MVPLEFVAMAHDDVISPFGGENQIVGNKTVTPLHQIKNTLTLPDSTLADEEEAYSVNIGEGTVEANGRGQPSFQVWVQPLEEGPGPESGPEHGDLVFRSRLKEVLGDREILRHENYRDLMVEEFLQAFLRHLGIQVLQIGHLRFTKNLGTPVTDPLHEPRQRQSGTGRVGMGDRALKARRGGEILKSESAFPFLEKVLYSDLSLHASPATLLVDPLWLGWDPCGPSDGNGGA